MTFGGPLRKGEVLLLAAVTSLLSNLIDYHRVKEGKTGQFYYQ